MKPFLQAVLIALIVLLGACANPSPTPTVPANTPTADALPTQRPTAIATRRPVAQATPINLADDVLVVYRKHGGIAGMDETLVVHQGGLLELTQRGGAMKTVQADEPLIQFVRRMVEQKEFGTLDELYQAAGADLFVYTVTARDANGQIKTVTTMDAAKTPPYLGQLIALLEQVRTQIK